MTLINIPWIKILPKEKSHIDRYGKAGFHACNHCLAAMLGCYCGFLDFYDAKGDMMAESRGKTENGLLAIPMLIAIHLNLARTKTHR